MKNKKELYLERDKPPQHDVRIRKFCLEKRKKVRRKELMMNTSLNSLNRKSIESAQSKLNYSGIMIE